MTTTTKLESPEFIPTHINIDLIKHKPQTLKKEFHNQESKA